MAEKKTTPPKPTATKEVITADSELILKLRSRILELEKNKELVQASLEDISSKIEGIDSKLNDLAVLVNEHPTDDGSKAVFAFSPHQNMILFRGQLTRNELIQEIKNHPEFKYFQTNICTLD